jgi:hypothetical protein
MTSLRERVIAIICEKWPNPDNEVLSATICELLQSGDGAVSAHDVLEVLLQLADHGDITLGGLEASRGTDSTVVGVDPKLCP